MDLCEVIDGIDVTRLSGRTDPQVLSVAYDSRKVTPGALFFALPGEKANGAEFAGDAIARGAIAVASSQARPAGIQKDVTWVQVAPGKERRALATAGANFYGRPADSLKLVGSHRDERKNDHGVLSRFDPADTRDLPRASWAPPVIAPRQARGPARTPRPNRSICTRCSRRYATPAARTRCWRPVPTPSPWTGCGAAISRWRFSRT